MTTASPQVPEWVFLALYLLGGTLLVFGILKLGLWMLLIAFPRAWQRLTTAEHRLYRRLGVASEAGLEKYRKVQAGNAPHLVLGLGGFLTAAFGVITLLCTWGLRWLYSLEL